LGEEPSGQFIHPLKELKEHEGNDSRPVIEVIKSTKERGGGCCVKRDMQNKMIPFTCELIPIRIDIVT